MSRQEDFIEAGIKYRFENGKPMAIGGDNFADVAKEMNRCKPYEAGDYLLHIADNDVVITPCYIRKLCNELQKKDDNANV